MRPGRTKAAASLVALALSAGLVLGGVVPAYAAGVTGEIAAGPGERGDWSPPPSPSDVAVAAARSVIGTRYVHGGANRRGFDCSGLTMWAWAHAGVSLPHSSRSQHRAVQHVPRSGLQLGDLVFFYHPIHHVGIYIGRGRMIDANHPGGSVRKRRVYWGHYAGAGRPDPNSG